MNSIVSKSTIGLSLMVLAMILGLPSSRSAPLEDAKFLRLIATQYSAPLVVSFLHSRIQKNEQMISKMEASLKGLDQSKRDVFDLAKKSLELLDEQLTGLEKADYFDSNGTERVKYFIEQYIMQNEMYPIEFGSYGVVAVDVTPDNLLEDMTVRASDELIRSINSMIHAYLADIGEKERSLGSNRMQKLAASMAKRKLQLLVDYRYPSSNNYNDERDSRTVAIRSVLRKVKTIVDFFYSQFNHLADPKSSEKMSVNAKQEIVARSVLSDMTTKTINDSP